METLVLSEKEIHRAAELLKKGQLVAFPTETVYGLGASSFIPTAIQEIFRVKGRPQDNPLIAHIAHLQDCHRLAIDLPKTFFHLVEAFFPGPLTLVVKKHPHVPAIVSGGLNTIAIRMPNHFVARALISEVGEALVAPSANLSGFPSSTTAQHVLHDFKGKIAAVIDLGPTLHGIESTVIDLVSFQKPTLLRLGALKKEEIEGVLGEPIDLYTTGPKSSPGMQYRHYAPKNPVYFFSQKDELEKHLSPEKKSLILSTEPLSWAYQPLQSKTLYAHLRLADQNGYDEVIIFCKGTQDAALLNRLEKICESNQH